ncbi:UDP-glucose dehydrogenase family protein [Methanosalsum natronophilum]|uniref:UDP-glucose dehydrogenase family protein n=1 Tax=Methanosalsum natronophilum TaxID=768733 RepID=UPI0021676D94|nr:UDP-glucose/GDP-mannose dehydrogenase family protein [Methanosalsum natronophilum]MCS3924337.1 UDPglucose 6-dehydrogenase [Methanosalsum natronophilum]
MKLSVIGTGYVGTVTAACFAELGHEVICVDTDEKKVDMINSRQAPIIEDGLDEILKRNVGVSLHATNNYEEAVRNTDFSFICVGTPSDIDGNIDLQPLKNACRCLGTNLRNKKKYHCVVVKSTVVPKTTEDVVIPIIEKESGKSAGSEFGVSMNPEFLREGKAVYDFMNPDKIVIGGIDKRSQLCVKELYDKIDTNVSITDLKTAEMIKYVNNSFLATKVSFANEIGNICKLMGINTYEVMEQVGKDFRISPHFLRSGAGFGGSCFPKDVRALIGKSIELGYDPKILQSVIELNEKQPLKVIDILKKKMNKLEGTQITVLGLAFKSGTDDIRESSSIPIINYLLEKGAYVVAYDPLAMNNMRNVFSNIRYTSTIEEALENSDACLLMTDWDEFREIDNELNLMKRKLVIDARYVLNPNDIKADIKYEGLCW